MTIGTGVLLLLETSPPRPAVALALSAREAQTPLEQASLQALYSARVPPQPQRWRYIVIHDSVCTEGCTPIEGGHFLISDAPAAHGGSTIETTARWRGQSPGQHVPAAGESPYNAQSIGICVMGDTLAQAPSGQQMESLVALVRALQQQFGIHSEHVYLHGELTGAPCPGQQFPVAAFRARLMP